MQNTKHRQNIDARIIADSINPAGSRLTSFVLKYPRFIHAELMTHRAFSRNAASSRAIPMKKMIERVESAPARFIFWGSNKPGMQATESLDEGGIAHCDCLISEMRQFCIQRVRELELSGLHKQNANRYLEPFGHIEVLVTATDYENFFSLRVHKDAQPEFQELATKMGQAWIDSSPDNLEWGDWHIPEFAGVLETDVEDGNDLLKVATARCARLSYLTFDGTHELAKDLKIHNDLSAAGHWSPFEHCAQAVETPQYPWSNFDAPALDVDPRTLTPIILGLSHWKQYRKCFPNERRRITKEELRNRITNRPSWINL